MLPRPQLLQVPGLNPRQLQRLFSVSARMASTTPMEDVMRDKVCTVLLYHLAYRGLGKIQLLIV